MTSNIPIHNSNPVDPAPFNSGDLRFSTIEEQSSKRFKNRIDEYCDSKIDLSHGIDNIYTKLNIILHDSFDKLFSDDDIISLENS